MEIGRVYQITDLFLYYRFFPKCTAVHKLGDAKMAASAKASRYIWTVAISI